MRIASAAELEGAKCVLRVRRGYQSRTAYALAATWSDYRQKRADFRRWIRCSIHGARNLLLCLDLLPFDFSVIVAMTDWGIKQKRFEMACLSWFPLVCGYCVFGGEGGIRTPVGILSQTRFPGEFMKTNESFC